LFLLALLFLGTNAIIISPNVTAYPILSNFNLFARAPDCGARIGQDNQCLACYLRPGCTACSVGPSEFVCVPTVQYTLTGPVYGNETCAALNTTYGSHRIGPVDCFWEGMGKWIYKLTNRHDIRLLDADIIDIESLTAINLARIHSIIDPIQNLSVNITPLEVVSFLTKVKLLIEAKAANISVEVINSFAKWDIDTAQNVNFTEGLQDRLNRLKISRFSAENASELNEALITAEFVKVHHTLSTFHYCWAAQRLQERLVLHERLSDLLENVHILILFTTLQDLNEYQSEFNLCPVTDVLLGLCTWNSTAAKFISEALAEAKITILEYILECEQFKAYLDVLTVKVSALVERKCVRELHLLTNLDAVIQKLKSDYYAAISDLRADTANTTTVEDIIDVFMDFMDEVEDINGTIVKAVDHLSWEWSIKQDWDSVGETILEISQDFCRSLKPFMIAHFGIEPAGHVCDPTTALAYYKKRQNSLSNNPPASSYTMTTQTGASNLNSGPTGTGTFLSVSISLATTGVLAGLLL